MVGSFSVLLQGIGRTVTYCPLPLDQVEVVEPDQQKPSNSNGKQASSFSEELAANELRLEIPARQNLDTLRGFKDATFCQTLPFVEGKTAACWMCL